MKAFDTETSGLSWQQHAIVGYVFTFSTKPGDSYYIPVRHAGTGNIGSQPGLTSATGWDGKLADGEKELLDAALQAKHRYVGHNLSFDLKFLYRVAGTDAFIPQFEDTMVNEPLLNEHAGKFSLDACCLRHGVQAKKGQQIYDHIHTLFPEVPATASSMGHFWRLSGDDAMAVDYAEGDGTSTFQLREAHMPGIKEQELERVWDLECRLIRVLARMTCKGIRIDVDKTKALQADLTKQINTLMEKLPEGASVRSPKDVRAWLESNGVTGGWPVTPKRGQPSFTEDYLKTIAPGRDILDIRHLSHLRDSFITPLIETHIWRGRVHANYNQMRGDEYGTITGRLSCDSPNLQQAHKRDAVRGRMLRGLFLPDEGKIFAEVDYSQAEPRLLAYYSRCKTLIDGYTSTPFVDAHTAVAKAIDPNWDNLPKAEQKALRENSKRVNQTIISSGGKGVIVARYGVDPREVDRIWNDWFKAMPEVKVFQRKATNRMRKQGYVFSLLGRRSRLIDPHKDYVAVNRLLQMGNADLMKAALVRMDDYLESVGRPLDVLNTIHDAADFQFDEAARVHYNKCLDIMRDVTSNESPIHLDIPMEVEAGEGCTWALATFGPEEK